MKCEDRSHEQTERQQRCARSKAWNLARNIKLQSYTATFYSPAEKWVLPVASTKEPEEREFAVDSRVSMHTVSKRETLTLPSWRPWWHREVRRRWWRPTARCKPEKKPRCTSKNWTCSWRWCFMKKLSQFFRLGSSARIMDTLATGPAVKNTSHQKWQKNWLQFFTLCAIRSPWFIDEFLYNAHTDFLIIFITGFCIWYKQIHRKSSTRKKWKYEWGATEKTDRVDQQKPKT